MNYLVQELTEDELKDTNGGFFLIALGVVAGIATIYGAVLAGAYYYGYQQGLEDCAAEQQQGCMKQTFIKLMNQAFYSQDKMPNVFMQNS